MYDIAAKCTVQNGRRYCLLLQVSKQKMETVAVIIKVTKNRKNMSKYQTVTQLSRKLLYKF